MFKKTFFLIGLALWVGTSLSWADFRQDWQQTVAEIDSTHSSEASAALDRLGRYFMPLDQRLEKIINVQSDPEARGALDWALMELVQARNLAGRSKKISQNLHKKEFFFLLSQAIAAQKKSKLGNKFLKTARAKTQAALDLLRASSKKNKKGQPKQQNSASKQNHRKPAAPNEKKQKTAPQPKSTEGKSSQNTKQSSSGQTQKIANKAKKALKELLKLQQQTEQRKKMGRRRFRVRQRGQEAAEKNW